jgi:uncharacterized protein YidB (DUF937 family)
MSAMPDDRLVRRAVLIATQLGGGGLAELRERFVRAGVGPVFDSWVAICPNLPIDAEIVSMALGDSLAVMARATRCDDAQLAHMLAGILPQIIDEMTPDGVLPEPPRGWFARLRVLLKGA